mmetsp:Transcript_116432/g.292829  ORF Transcript_116432/g.292829 Transcript_116432/m.292829 type:complete len:250 (-) Transcript_116432:188-937(-)
MPFAHRFVISLVGVALAAADYEPVVSDGMAASFLEEDVVGLLQITRSNGSKVQVANETMSQESAIKDAPRGAVLPVASRVASADGAALHKMADIADAGQRQHEIELPQVPAQASTKSKVALIVITALGLGFCGVDRCYMGATCCGIIKGITAGGLGIWAIIDWVVIIINSLEKSSSINALGFEADFSSGSVGTAYWIALIMLAIPVISCLCCGTCFCFGLGSSMAVFQGLGKKKGNSEEKPSEAVTETS